MISVELLGNNGDDNVYRVSSICNLPLFLPFP